MNVCIETALILNLRNVALDHKQTCGHNCNVSLGQLYQAALYIYETKRLFPMEESVLVRSYLAEMKELH